MEIDSMQLLQCTRDALDIAKKTTRLIREAWSQRESDISLLAMNIAEQANPATN